MRGRGDTARGLLPGLCVIEQVCAPAAALAVFGRTMPISCNMFVFIVLGAISRVVAGQFAIGGRAILPAAGFQPALAAQKGGCGQDWPPSKAILCKLTHCRESGHRGPFCFSPRRQAPANRAKKTDGFEGGLPVSSLGRVRVNAPGSRNRLLAG